MPQLGAEKREEVTVVGRWLRGVREKCTIDEKKAKSGALKVK